MTERYKHLAQRFTQEIVQLTQIVATIERHWRSFHESDIDQDAYLNSVAFSLQSFYTGLEHLFQAVAQEFEGDLPQGGNWHRVLLERMADEIEGYRPPVLSKEIAERLIEYMQFRHVARHIYGFLLDAMRLSDLVEGLPDLWEDLQMELEAFSQFLAKLGGGET